MKAIYDSKHIKKNQKRKQIDCTLYVLQIPY